MVTRMNEPIRASASERGDADHIREALQRKSAENLSLLPKDFFGEHRDIQLTVVMLSYGRLERTLAALQALREHVRIPCKLVLIDNNSGYEVQARLTEVCAKYDFVELVLLKENLGATGGREFALNHVQTEYVMFLDNDIEIFPGAVEHLLFALESHPEVVAATGKIVFPDGRVHLCGGNYRVEGDMLFYDLLGAGEPFDAPLVGSSGLCRWVNAGSTMLRRRVLLEQPYDPELRFYYEDLEWCYRLNQIGAGSFYRSVEALMLHYHEPKVPDQSVPADERRAQAVNYLAAIARFYAVHGKVIQNVFDFLPELGQPGSPHAVSSAKIVLELISAYGSEWFLQRWGDGELAPVLTVQALRAEVTEKKQVVQALQAEVREREKAMQALQAELADKEQAIHTLTSQLANITNSTGWELLQLLSRVRLWIAPHGGQRERVLQLGMRGLRLWQRQGLKSLARGAVRKARVGLERFQRRALDMGRSVVPYPVRRFLRRTIMRKPTALRYPTAAAEAESQPEPLAQPGRLYDVIIFPIIDWDFRFQRPQQIAVRFAQDGHRVFYVRTTLREGDRPTIRSIQERVFEVQMPGPSHVTIYAEAMDEGLRQSLQNACGSLRREYDIVEAVCLVDLPFWTTLAFTLRDTYGWKVVYDCMDRHSGFATNTQRMLAQEDELCRGSDLILCTSHLLFSVKSSQNPNCSLVPNAADFDHFRLAPLAVPEEMQGLDRPIMGYYGAISAWFDSELVRALALARPKWQFVLIGGTYGANLAPLRGLPNVHLLPEKSYAALPAYLHAFDVCIIPFKRTPLTEATNPVKLFEFLSAGKAVVATDLAELQRYSHYVRLADGPSQWLTAVEGALHDRAPERVAARIEFARQNTWEERVATVRAAILSLYPKVSIIIVTYNNLDCTRLCLNSIYEKTVYPNIEVIVVDNASTDGTAEFLEGFSATHPNLRVESNDTNEGFASANNRALAVASGEYIVFLNNDTVVTRGWLSRLIRHLADAQVGMVGPVTNWSGNESKIEVGYSGMQEMEAFARAYTQVHEGETFDISMLSFLCVAMRCEVVQQVGPLDERFGLGTFEDDDYALRVRQKGYRIVCAEDVFVHHWGMASFSQLSDKAYLQLFDENRRQFEQKWGLTWKPHQSRKVP